MHAVMITFASSAPLADLHDPFENYAKALTTVPGLLMKIWISQESTVGGFHVFTDKARADAYLQGDLCATVLTNSAFTEFKVRHFDVIDDLSAITGTPLAAELMRSS